MNISRAPFCEHACLICFLCFKLQEALDALNKSAHQGFSLVRGDVALQVTGRCPKRTPSEDTVECEYLLRF